ncbi:MAG: hypothetical protein JXB30_16630 [Anaerolineae bacterium]|nr:hypothetical protein [Anaerolineae bacterium]
MSFAANSTRNIFYPAFGLARLRSRKGQRWAALVDWISTLNESTPEVMAFTLTMRRLNRSHDHSQDVCRDPFCALCATSIVDSFNGGEEALLAAYHANLAEVNHTLATMRMRPLAKRTNIAVA